MNFKAFVLTLLLMIGFTTVSAAQSDAERTFRSRHGHDCCQNFDEYKEFCAIQGLDALGNPPRCVPRGTGEGGGGGSMLSLKGSPASALIRSGIIGELFGMALGSLAQDPGGTPQWQAGGNLGAGLMVLMAVGANSGDWGRPANAFVTAVSGGLMGASVGQATDAGVIGGKDPVYTTAESKIVPYAAAGAGAGLFLGMAFPGRSQFGLFPNGRVSSFHRGSITGLRISW